MGSAVRSVTKVVKDPKRLAEAAVTMGGSEVLRATTGKGVLDTLGGVVDAASGKVSTPTGYNPNAAPFKASAEQLVLQEQLKKQALGQGDPTSVAQQQLRTGTDRNIAQIAGSVAGQRNNQALAMRQGMRAQAGVNQEAAGQAAALRSTEMGNAQEAYSQDLSRQQQSAQNLEGMRSGIAGATQGLQFQANQQKAKGLQDMIGSAAGAGMMAFSDKNLKKEVKDVDTKSIEEFLTKTQGKNFKYKQPNGESYQDGTVTGVMAQDLEKSKLGKSMVVNSPEGKQVDLKKAVPVTMAAVSEIMKRIKKLESDKPKKEEA